MLKRMRDIDSVALGSLSKRQMRAIAPESAEHYDEFVSSLPQSTPYGDLICKLQMPKLDGGSYDWHFINPFALLWQLCARHTKWGKIDPLMTQWHYFNRPSHVTKLVMNSHFDM